MELIPVEKDGKNFSMVNQGDVVILPAFGAAVQEMRTLKEKQVQIVDTTCPWVSKVITSFLQTVCHYFACLTMKLVSISAIVGMEYC